MEELTYTGFQQILEPYEPELIVVPTDAETGMDVEAVEAQLRGGARPAFIYAISDGHNPLGASMQEAKRRYLIDLARQYHVPILEDDAYGFLHYGEKLPPPLRSLDDQWVFYIGSFSKVLAPALRVGWIVAPEFLMPKLSIIKEASDIDTGTLPQRAVAAYIAAGHLPDHIAVLRDEYRLRRDAMQEALERHFPPEARWTRPASGLFFWVELPEGTDTDRLLHVALETEDVAFIPGSAFGVGPSARAKHCLRLNFSNSSVERIREGVGRLARVLEGAA